MAASIQETRVTVLGAGSVGKSALTVRLVTGNFIENYDPTIEDSYRKTLIVDGITTMLDILDTAGQEEFRSMMDKWMREADGVMLVFDITTRVTYEEVLSKRKKLILLHQKLDRVPLILIGNKVDLVEEKEKDRCVTRAEAEIMAKNWKCQYLETSAKTGVNAEKCFVELLKSVRKVEKEDEKPEKKKIWCTLL